MNLKHRVVLSPMTRFRTNDDHVPLPYVAEYYSQRASVPGTLLITEGTIISPESGGWRNAPGIYSTEQINAWKQVKDKKSRTIVSSNSHLSYFHLKVTDAVHAKGSFIYLQIFAMGRAADPAYLAKLDPPAPYVSVSEIPLSDASHSITPRPLTIPEIEQYIHDFASAATNAIRAGFDGVEFHAANGYLADQFLQDTSNNRTDKYGGSVENRARFVLESVEAIVKAIGVKKTAVRLSPWSTFQGDIPLVSPRGAVADDVLQDMRMTDPIPTFSYLVTRLRDLYPDLAFVHVIEPRVSGSNNVDVVSESDSNDFIRDIWRPRPLISAGGYTRATGIKTAEIKGDLIGYGRSFLANVSFRS